MKILMVNKFLHANGGSETYIFELGKELVRKGHEVEYFGMDHPDRLVGNSANEYVNNMDFHRGGRLSKLFYPFKIIYSREAVRKIRIVLDKMQPDVVHLNNINFQLTPAIITEIRRWQKDNDRSVRIVATIHDPQWVCPNHMLIDGRGEKCRECLSGHYGSCVKKGCVHGSKLKSLLAAIEAVLYRRLKTYRQVDTVITPSRFMAGIMGHNPDVEGRIAPLYNCVSVTDVKEDKVADYKKRQGLNEDTPYVLYFGSFSEEKGIHTLTAAAAALPEILFIFAGSGPEEDEVNAVDNIINVGFTTGEDLVALIKGASFSLIASECYENCPFTVMESLSLGIPVIGSDIGGIPELIDDKVTGELFPSGDAEALRDKIYELYNDEDKLRQYRENCSKIGFDDLGTYTDKVIKIYTG